MTSQYSRNNVGIKGLVLATGLASCVAGCSKEEIVMPGAGLSIDNVLNVEGIPSNDKSLNDFNDNYKAKADETYVERPLSAKYHLLFNGNKINVGKKGTFVFGNVLNAEKGKHMLSTDLEGISIKTIRFYSWEYNPENPANCKDKPLKDGCWHYIKSMDVKNKRFEFKTGDYGKYQLEIDIVKDGKEEGKRYFFIDVQPQKISDSKDGETRVIIEKVKKERPSLKKVLKVDNKKVNVPGKEAPNNRPNHRIRFLYQK